MKPPATSTCRRPRATSGSDRHQLGREASSPRRGPLRPAFSHDIKTEGNMSQRSAFSPGSVRSRERTSDVTKYFRRAWLVIVCVSVVSSACGVGANLSSEGVATSIDPILNGTRITRNYVGIVDVTQHGLYGQCAGTLLNNSWVLTSKSCVQDPGDDIEYSSDDPGIFESRMATVVIDHPTLDVRLISLDSPFVMNGTRTSFINTVTRGRTSDIDGLTLHCFGEPGGTEGKSNTADLKASNT